MAAGPIGWCSAVPVTTGKVFPNIHVGAGSGGKHEEGLGVMASLDGDAHWDLRVNMPLGTLPSGTCKFRGFLLANATSGSAKINVKWASVAAGEDPSSATLNAEGVATITWAAGNNDDCIEFKVTLDADTPVAGEVLVIRLTFETASWTLQQVLTLANAGSGVIWE